ncbi:hypothetical protein FEE96_22940 [Parasedimentitalea maritima]|uniref:Uncharacterized protein n=1 Tax=Parasedimentitalea maritima TaxID=2578117 RepID=A0ABY2UQW3_9RHOB|nr:hypothetical protein [Zongyanglinia marina]TLP55333.1 hypothetical protein FEE96_22940 [Zongyanglinia marina]
MTNLENFRAHLLSAGFFTLLQTIEGKHVESDGVTETPTSSLPVVDDAGLQEQLDEILEVFMQQSMFKLVSKARELAKDE